MRALRNKSRLSKSISCWATLWVLALVMMVPIQLAHGQTVQYAFTNFAGMPGDPRIADGGGSAARFRIPEGVAGDRAGSGTNASIPWSEIGARAGTGYHRH